LDTAQPPLEPLNNEVRLDHEHSANGFFFNSNNPQNLNPRGVFKRGFGNERSKHLSEAKSKGKDDHPPALERANLDKIIPSVQICFYP